MTTDAAISLQGSMSSSGGSMSALDATIRPIDALSSAGLGWLTPYVQPLQDVVDRMAGMSSVIQTFTDGWQPEVLFSRATDPGTGSRRRSRPGPEW